MLVRMATRDAIVVLVTTASEEEATALGRLLIQQRLVACVTILPHVKSIFQWKDNISEEEEWLMILKTRRPLFAALEKAIIAEHSYDVPEIIALSILNGSQPYLAWVDAMTKKPNLQ